MKINFREHTVKNKFISKDHSNMSLAMLIELCKVPWILKSSCIYTITIWAVSNICSRVWEVQVIRQECCYNQKALMKIPQVFMQAALSHVKPASLITTLQSQIAALTLKEKTSLINSRPYHSSNASYNNSLTHSNNHPTILASTSLDDI